MKVVLDTNIWLSGLFWKREASKIIELAEKERIKVIISEEIILEIIDVLNKEIRFQKFLKNKNQNIEDLIRNILNISELIKTHTKLDIIKEHPADNIILEVALDGKVNYIISYNRHVLNLREFRGIKIMPPGEFLEIIK